MIKLIVTHVPGEATIQTGDDKQIVVVPAPLFLKAGIVPQAPELLLDNEDINWNHATQVYVVRSVLDPVFREVYKRMNEFPSAAARRDEEHSPRSEIKDTIKEAADDTHFGDGAYFVCGGCRHENDSSELVEKRVGGHTLIACPECGCTEIRFLRRSEFDVIVEVEGGVANVTKQPDGLKVRIVDHD